MWGLFGNVFMIHAPFGGVHDHIFSAATVQEVGHIKFVGLTVPWIIDILGDQYLVHLFSLGRGLWRNQVHPDDTARQFLHFLQVLGQFHASSLATSPGMDLGLDDMPSGPRLLGELFGGIHRFLVVSGNYSPLDPYAKIGQNLFSLIFVKVHVWYSFYYPAKIENPFDN